MVTRMIAAADLGRASVEALSHPLVEEFGTAINQPVVKQVIGHMVRQLNRALKSERRPLKSKLPHYAASLSPWSGSKEKAVVHMKTKESGDYRLYMDFGLENRSLQYLLLPLLETTADLYPYQYLTRGGVPAAIDKVTELLLDGYVWTIEFDLKDCFPSFDGKNLDQFLPLPEKVIRNVIMADTLNVTLGNDCLDKVGPADGDPGDPFTLAKILADARRGIPQGSAASSLIAEILLAGPLKALPGIAVVPSYADNMLIMARTEEDVVSIAETLWSALKAHSVGHLLPKRLGSSRPGETVHFLGHDLALLGTKVKATPDLKNEAKFNRKVKDGLAALDKVTIPIIVRKARARDLKRFISSWTSNFSRCDGMEKRKMQWLAKIDAAIPKSKK